MNNHQRILNLRHAQEVFGRMNPSTEAVAEAFRILGSSFMQQHKPQPPLHLDFNTYETGARVTLYLFEKGHARIDVWGANSWGSSSKHGAGLLEGFNPVCGFAHIEAIKWLGRWEGWIEDEILRLEREDHDREMERQRKLQEELAYYRARIEGPVPEQEGA